MARLLTAREKEIVRLVYLLGPSKEIAETLLLSEQTVKNHLNTIYRKIGVSNRIDLAIRAEALLAPENGPRVEKKRIRRSKTVHVDRETPLHARWHAPEIKSHVRWVSGQAEGENAATAS
jgi:DNA-binding CsgD family transcriptional regulator